MWISDGCRGIFTVVYKHGAEVHLAIESALSLTTLNFTFRAQQPVVQDGEDQIMCESWDLKRTECRGRAPISWLTLNQKASWRSCEENVNYGLVRDRTALWVDDGACGA